jgi:hypothetical protein
METKVYTAEEIAEKILQDCPGKPETKDWQNPKMHECHWQGDVGFVMVKSVTENGIPGSGPGCELRSYSTEAVNEKDFTGQLAEGETLGARHIIAPSDRSKVRVYRLTGATALDGYVLDVLAPIEVTHPEHGHVFLHEGTYRCRHQRMYADELRRVLD